MSAFKIKLKTFLFSKTLSFAKQNHHHLLPKRRSKVKGMAFQQSIKDLTKPSKRAAFVCVPDLKKKTAPSSIPSHFSLRPDGSVHTINTAEVARTLKRTEFNRSGAKQHLRVNPKILC